MFDVGQGFVVVFEVVQGSVVCQQCIGEVWCLCQDFVVVLYGFGIVVQVDQCIGMVEIGVVVIGIEFDGMCQLGFGCFLVFLMEFEYVVEVIGFEMIRKFDQDFFVEFFGGGQIVFLMQG